MTLAKVFQKTDRWLRWCARVRCRNTHWPRQSKQSRRRRRRKKKRKRLETVEWSRTAASEPLLMSVRRRARENSDTSSAALRGSKIYTPSMIAPVWDRVLSCISSPPKVSYPFLSFSLGFLFGFRFGVKESLLRCLWQPEKIVFHQPESRIYSWLAIFDSFLMTTTRHTVLFSLNVLPLFLSLNAGRDS